MKCSQPHISQEMEKLKGNHQNHSVYTSSQAESNTLLNIYQEHMYGELGGIQWVCWGPAGHIAKSDISGCQRIERLATLAPVWKEYFENVF